MYPFEDMTLSFSERAADLVSRMTLEEKISWCGAWAMPIPRLGIPAWHYANEASHGISALDYINDNRYNVTSFPVCLALSQSWDPELISQITRAISDEARAAHNIGGETLSFWCPTINMAHDPRNGRSDENFGEDPFLTGRLAAAYIQGLQGKNESKKYLKTAATPKHFMMNSSENNRNSGISFADERTIREYYASAFEYAVREGKAESMMVSYNRVNGIPAAANSFLLTKLLREEWGFDGYVVSDCGAVAQTLHPGKSDVGQKAGVAHGYYQTNEEASAGTLVAGCDMSGGGEHRTNLMNAVQQGLITESQIEQHVLRNLTSLFRQGIFDAPGSTPWDKLGAEQMASSAHDALALKAANDSIVLLKNEKGLLPISKQGIRKILVVGPNARYRELGGYSCGKWTVAGGLDTKHCTLTFDAVLQELADDNIEVQYEKGWCTDREFGIGALEGLEALPGVDLDMIRGMMRRMMGISSEEERKPAELPEYIPYHDPEDPDFRGDNEALFSRALESAKTADLVIVVAGTDAGTASEGSDRTTIALPNQQGEKIERILEANPNTIVVLSAMGVIGDPSLDRCHSLIYAPFGGQEQGKAIVNVLFGHVNPNAKLTTTWVRDDSQLPALNDYGIRKSDILAQDHGRTYWYFDEEPRFPFGYGLHYTTFEYDQLRLEECAIPNGGTLRISVRVTNTGERAGSEIVELYIHQKENKDYSDCKWDHLPVKQLKGFRKIALNPGEAKTVEIEVPLQELARWDAFRQKMRIYPGEYIVEIGKSSTEIVCSSEFKIVGEWDAPLRTVHMTLDRYCLKIGEYAHASVVATLADTCRLPLGKEKLSFCSSNEAVASVSMDGTILAQTPGTAMITASVTYNGQIMQRAVPVAVREFGD